MNEAEPGRHGRSGAANNQVGGPPAAMQAITIVLPPEQIALFKAIVESYDNLATLRTEDPARHLLRLVFAPEAASDVEALLAELRVTFAIERVA